MWRMGRFFELPATTLGDVRLVTFVVVAAAFFLLGYLGRLPRTQRYYIPRGTVSDMEVSAGF